MSIATSFQSGRIAIHYSDTGEGTPIVLVHGFSSSSEMWSEFPELEGYRVVKIDCRGHGASDKPENPTDYGENMVEDVHLLFKHLGISKAHLVGYSMGAEISIRLATRYPEFVQSLTVGGSGWSQENDADNYNMLSTSLIETGSFEGVFRAMWPDMSEEEIAAANSLIGEQDPAGLAAVAAGMHQIICIPTDDFSNCHFPVLGITGELDPERNNIEQLAEVFPDFRLTIIPRADHISAIVDPLFYTTITAFIAEH